MQTAVAEVPARAISRPWSTTYWFVIPAAIAVVSRLYSVFLLFQYTADAAKLPLLVGNPSPFVAWDGQWYLHIAETGYHANPLQPAGLAGGHHDFAFYPGWPALIRLVSLNGTLPYAETAVVLANVLFVLAAIVVYRFVANRFSERTAIGATLLLAFNPVAYVFSMAYTEALFVLLAGLYFVNQFRKSSAILAGLSMLVRISGLAIGAAALTEFLRGREGRLRPFLIGAAVFLAFAAWWTFIWRLTGKFTGWFEGSASWAKGDGIVSIVRDLRERAPLEVLWFAFVALMIGGSLLLLRRHPELAVYCLVAIGLTLVGAPANSMPRHAMVAFPAFAAIADRIGPRGSALLAVVFAVGQILFVDFAFGAVHRPP